MENVVNVFCGNRKRNWAVLRTQVAFGKTEEEKNIKRAEKEQIAKENAEDRRIEGERREEQDRSDRVERENLDWIGSLAGLASSAKQNGEGFFEIGMAQAVALEDKGRDGD